MKTRIQLLSTDLRPPRKLLDFQMAKRIWLFCVLLMVVLFGVYDWQQLDLEEQLKKLKQVESQLNAQHEQLARAQAEVRVSPDLKAMYADVELEAELKRKLMERVQEGAASVRFPYSSFLTDISVVNEPKIWLDNIVISRDNILLSGLASEADIIPEWLTLVGQQGYLLGRPFNKVTISEEPPYHRFELHAEPKLGDRK
ncbi:hypothetical protein [Echinimonas agarilytica]|uniref:Uncharacterized protein n=1 Tax=Echinimonas agarilytica TaxID=1215918 RepID=A0AA42B6B7_9GAMM|nr:hypothetical protein [Echinimonas agarilytica]MCM2678577.1 hypothetical protein [Echinimonas agarilytica]